MKKYLLLLAVAPSTAMAAFPPTVTGFGNPEFIFGAPDTLADFHGGYCEDFNRVINKDTGKIYKMDHCSTTPQYAQIWPVLPSGLDVSSDMQTFLAASNYSAAKGMMFTGTTAQYVRGDGSLATLPSSGTGTVTSVGVAGNNGISVSGSPVTTSGSITVGLGAITPTSVVASGNVTGANLSGTNTGDQTSVSGNAGTATKLATGRTLSITGDLAYTSPAFDGSGAVTAAGTLANSGVSAGTYNYSPAGSITVDAKGRVTSAVSASRSYNYTTRALNTCFQPSATSDVFASYAVDIATVSTLASGQVGTVYLKTYTNNSCTTGAQEVTRFVNGNTQSLGLTVTMNQNVTGTLTGIIPTGKYAKLETENTTGTPTFTARPGQEATL